jgi:hypothetical protein
MTAHDVELLGRRLGDLNERAVGQLALAVLAFGLALAATQLRRDLVVPLLVGAIVLTALGLTAFVRRSLLVEDAALDRDAYALEVVRRYAARLTTRERREEEADAIRRLLVRPEGAIAERVEANRTRLEAIADELTRDDLSLDPISAVALDRLLAWTEESPLYDEQLPSECVRSRLVQIEAGFEA